MKRTLSLLLAALLLLSLCSFPAFAEDARESGTPEDILAQMTTEEKIAQLALLVFFHRAHSFAFLFGLAGAAGTEAARRQRGERLIGLLLVVLLHIGNARALGTVHAAGADVEHV